MFTRLQSALSHIQQNLAQQITPDALLQLCHDHNLRFRKRKFTPLETIPLFLLQILHGNFAIQRLRDFTAVVFSEAAYCKARMRLPFELLQDLLKRVTGALQTTIDENSKWLGHRVFHIDGSSFSMPDTPELQNAFGQPGGQQAGCGFPTAHLMVLFHASTGFLLNIFAAPLRTHDMKQAVLTHPELQPGDVLIGDRGFCSYAHLALLCQRGVHALFRAHQKQLIKFEKNRPYDDGKKTSQSKRKGLPKSRWLKQLGFEDQLVEYIKPKVKPAWMSNEEFKQLPATLLVRELCYRIESKGVRSKEITIVTTLTDATLYSKLEVARLYQSRWAVETNLRHLKETMHMDVLRCESKEGVRRELMMFAIAYNMVRSVMCKAAEQQNVDVDRVSFKDALC